MGTETGSQEATGRTAGLMAASYVLIFLSPIVSILLTLGPVRWAQELLFNARGQQETDLLFYPDIVQTAANLFAIAVLTVGLVMFTVCVYLNGEAPLTVKKFGGERGMVVLSSLLVLWGTITAFAGLFMYGFLLDWAGDPAKRAISIWEYMEYGTWMLKGVLWAVSGFLLIRAFKPRLSVDIRNWLFRDNAPAKI